MTETSRKRYRRCSPSKEFRSLMEWYRGRPGIECPYAGCDLLTPDHSMLDVDQLNYYLWWRGRLSEGTFLRTDRGYVWLRICEIINASDPEQGLREVEVLKSHSSETGLSPEAYDRIAADICISNDMDIPASGHEGDEVAEKMMISEMLGSLPDLGPERLRFLLKGTAAEAVEDPGVLKRISGALKASEVEECRIGTETSMRPLFPGYSWFGPPAYLVTYDVYSDGIRRLMDDAFAFCTGQGSPSRSFAGRTSEDPGDRRSERRSSRIPVSSKDMELIELGKEQFGEEPPVGRKGKDSIPLKGPDGALEGYVPSGTGTPDYRKLSEPQRMFYSLWSSEADSGRYRDTDTGYLWMRLCGLVNSSDDPSEVLDSLMAIRSAYGSDPRLGRICMDYALKNGLPIPDASLAEDDDEAGMVMGQYLCGNMSAKPDKDVLLRIAGLLNSGTAGTFDPEMAEAMRRTLMNANTELLKAGRPDAVSMCKKSLHERRLFECRA